MNAQDHTAAQIAEWLANFFRETDAADLETLNTLLDLLRRFENDREFVRAPGHHPTGGYRAELFYSARGFVRECHRRAERLRAEAG